LPSDLPDRDREIGELERHLAGLRARVEKLGGEVVRADYKVLHLTQEVRRAREAFGFLTGFQNSISRATSLRALYAVALKVIIAELWMKRAVIFEREPASGATALRPVSHLGYEPKAQLPPLLLDPSEETEWSRPQVVNGDTEARPWIDAVRKSLGVPFFVWIPGVKNGVVDTVFAAGALTEDGAQEPRLTGHDLDLFVSVGAILWVGRLNLIARGRLRKQVRYEALLHRLSELLLQDFDAPTARMDEVLRRVGVAWSLDRARLLTRRQDDRMSAVSHEWASRKLAPLGSGTEHPLERVPTWQDAMANGETIRIDDVDALPPAESAPLKEQGIRSLLLVPITVQRAVVGWVSFEQCAFAREWHDDDVRLLEVIAALVSRAVARAREIDERAQLEAEYHHSKKMEAIGQLAGGIAHDFNNLLTTIQGYAQLLTARLPQEYRDMAGLKEIIMASERAAGLTGQLLAFSRRDAASSGPVEINTVISDTMKLLRRMMGERITVELRLGQDLPAIVGDQQQIAQIIMNLAVNARDAMPDGGKLTVSTHQFAAVGALSRRFSIPGVEWCQVIQVTDTGQGIDDDTKEHIFEPFFTTKGVGQGTGLGLSIVFSAVRRHGGFIDVTSEVNIGTTFSVFLPVRPAVEEKTEDRPAATRTQRGHETILVVEDDDSVRAMIREVLESQGYRILTAANGREAIDELDRTPEDVSLVMTDVVMPEMDGREMWENLSARGCTIPFIVMSGFPQSRDSGEFLKGAAAYIQKPFGPRDIARVVRLTLDAASKSAPTQEAAH
jgi:signal transduction histidine kinase/ActR/RegA family two-component response regulator